MFLTLLFLLSPIRYLHERSGGLKHYKKYFSQKLFFSCLLIKFFLSFVLSYPYQLNFCAASGFPALFSDPKTTTAAVSSAPLFTLTDEERKKKKYTELHLNYQMKVKRKKTFNLVGKKKGKKGKIISEDREK